MRLTVGLLFVASGLLWACGAPVSTSSPSRTAAPLASPAATSQVTPEPAVSAEASESGEASPTPVASSQAPLSVVATTVDRLRVRSAPSLADSSIVRAPLLPTGTHLLVLGAPVTASGYDWLEVVPLASRALPAGWIASASQAGEPWVAAATFDCPPVPADMPALAALPVGVGLYCFGGRSITVQARILDCNCDAGGSAGSIDPGWMSAFQAAHPLILVAPEVTKPPARTQDWFMLTVDPDGTQPDPIPVGSVVTITGLFDHPAAAGCTLTPADGGPAVPSTACRLVFGVTAIAP